MQRIVTRARVPDYLLDMVKVVSEDSGYWPVLVEDDELPWDSEVSPASRSRPYHAISYSPAYVGHRHHLYFRGCAEVMREWIAREHGESAETEVDASGPCLQERVDAVRARHRSAAKPMPELVYRLTAWPVVLNAEAGILYHRRQAGARDCHKRQELYLARRMRELKAEIAQEPAEATAAELQAPLSILSWAFSSSVHMLLGVQLPDYLRESRYRVGGERLLACVRDMDFDGNLGDMQVTEAWIKELDLERLLDW